MLADLNTVVFNDR